MKKSEQKEMPKKILCENCKMRAKYDRRPQSLIGRFWHWHIQFCPGWKSYMETLDQMQRTELCEKYGLKKEKFL